MSGHSAKVFDIMGGLRGERSSMDGVQEILTVITYLSCLGVPVWLVVYFSLVPYLRTKRLAEEGEKSISTKKF